MPFWKNEKKILVIDDDHTLLRRVYLHLKRHKNLDVVIYDNATNGLIAAKASMPDLIILDWVLPDIQGIDALKTLKKSHKTKDIPVLMLTAQNTIGNVEEAFKTGASAYMIKPFSLKELAEKSFDLMKK